MINAELVKKTEKGDVYLYHFKNESGMEMTVTNYGANIMSIKAPDKNGRVEEITLGYDDVEGYENKSQSHPYFGSTIGRFANRIKDGRFTLNGKTYQLALNDGGHSLHGGAEGFNWKLWNGKAEGDTLLLTYVSPDGEENYPAELKTELRFSLTDDNEVVLDYTAQSDGDTVVNLTNHAYFNLNGCKDTILDHILTINADQLTETDAELIPTGKLRSVDGTPMDFRTPHKIGERVGEQYDLLVDAGGYDTNYVLPEGGMQKAAELYDGSSGRLMEVFTDQPGIQLYTSQAIAPGTMGRGGVEYKPFDAVCLETQHFADAPNHPEFPSTLLKKGDVFHSVTKYKFSAK